MMKRFACLTAVFLLAAACRQEAAFPPAPAMPRISLGIVDGDGVTTRSLLSDPDIETRITCVTLASYAGGELLGTAYYSGNKEGMTLKLPGLGTANVYALANMGDLRDALPARESALDQLQYRIPGYTTPQTGLNDRGLPMAGMLPCSAGDSELLIPLKRLMAKVSARLSVEWEGTLGSVRVRNLNAVLRPFGESRARGPEDLLEEEELAAGAGAQSANLVFYVPENLQGSVPSITVAADKSRDNAALEDRWESLTYLETEVAAREPYFGAMTYRSFLGENATSDFSIRRNCCYDWQLRYLEDGLSLQDWKHENGISWIRKVFNLFIDELTHFTGETIRVWPGARRDTYTGGVWKWTNWYYYPLQKDDVQWWEGDFTSPDYLTPRYWDTEDGSWHYTALRAGNGDLWGRYTDEWGSQTTQVRLYVYGPRPTLTLSVSPSEIRLGGTVNFTSILTTEDGPRDITHEFCSDTYDLDYMEYKWVDDYHGPHWEWVRYYSPRELDVDREGHYTPTEPGTRRFKVLYVFEKRDIESNEVSFTVAP